MQTYSASASTAPRHTRRPMWLNKIMFRALDTLWWVTVTYKRIISRISSVFTVVWDPFNISSNVIQSGGSRFVVVDADSEYERRVAAWFYRNNDTPVIEDWHECMIKFGLSDIYHKLRYDGFPFDVEIVLYNNRRFLRWGVKTNNVKLPVGGCGPDRILHSIFKIESMDNGCIINVKPQT